MQIYSESFVLFRFVINESNKFEQGAGSVIDLDLSQLTAY